MSTTWYKAAFMLELGKAYFRSELYNLMFRESPLCFLQLSFQNSNDAAPLEQKFRLK